MTVLSRGLIAAPGGANVMKFDSLRTPMVTLRGVFRVLAGRLRPYHSGALFLTHGRLLFRVTANELRARYAGSLLGFGWLVVGPVLFLSVYAAVYLFIYRFTPTGLTDRQYVVYLISGLVPYLATAEAISLGVTSVVMNRAIVANVVFPIDLVPAKSVFQAQPTAIVGFGVVLASGLVIGTVAWTWFLLPVVWILQVMTLVGVAWVISLLNIVLRDLTHAISVLLLVMLIASPIAYTPDQVPPGLRWLLILNPFAYFVVAYQQILVLGQVPTTLQLTGLIVVSFGSFLLGGWFFARAKGALIDYV